MISLVGGGLGGGIYGGGRDAGEEAADDAFESMVYGAGDHKFFRLNPSIQGGS